jgi:hypothetical protein
MIFLPYDNLKKSAANLDDFRLCHQRKVAKQIIDNLESKNPDPKVMTHPAVKMWVGYANALKVHHDILINEWISRGKNNKMKLMAENIKPSTVKMPWWFGCKELHRSHRAVLIDKFPQLYGKMFDARDKDYNDNQRWWPVKSNKTFVTIAGDKMKPKTKTEKK